MARIRLPSAVSRFPALFFPVSLFVVAHAAAQQPVSPLPPPVTRGLYRAHWFVFLTAFREEDWRAASDALEQMKRAARTVGVRRLSDFSRAALYEARVAESSGKNAQARRAYEAALELDDANLDAALSRIGFLVRQRSYREAARVLPVAARALISTEETRLALLSSFLIWAGVALAAALLGAILVLLAGHFSLIWHDISERANRSLGRRAAVPLALLIFFFPLGLSLGLVWLLLYWGALFFPYAERRERLVISAALIALGLLPAVVAAISRENVIERSPLYIASIDLEERREDASAEDGLRQASLVFPDEPDVWFLLGIFAERSGDNLKAQALYDRAVEAGPKDYRPLLNRGNLHFQEGEFAQAIQDYEAAAERSKETPEIYFNLALARAEVYDSERQAAAMKKANELSPGSVSDWSEHPPLARVVSAAYTVARAREKIDQWNREPRGRRLPGHALPLSIPRAVLSPAAAGAWAALALCLVMLFARSGRGVAASCVNCGRACCRFCRSYAESAPTCPSCSGRRRETVPVSAQLAQAKEASARSGRRARVCRAASLLFPGAHRLLSGSTASGFFVLFFFFLLIAGGWIGTRFFDPRQLPSLARENFFLPALAAAATVWAISLLSAVRRPHGT